jgi:starch phosphorylase
MARLTPQFSANRTVRDYTEMFYLPAAETYAARSAKSAGSAHALCRWRAELSRRWPHVHFGDVRSTTSGDEHLFRVEVYLGDLDPDAVNVELYADAMANEPPFRTVMARQQPRSQSGGVSLYLASAPASRPASDFTPRIVPFHSLARVPLEASHILWQH